MQRVEGERSLMGKLRINNEWPSEQVGDGLKKFRRLRTDACKGLSGHLRG